jgi:hypothetical protein
MAPIWLAQNTEDDEDNKKSVYPLIQQTALPVLQNWLKQDPNSQMAIDTDEQARQYLQGLCVYIDRVYGTKVLSDAIGKLKDHNNSAKDILDVLPEIIAQNEIDSIYLPAAATNAPIDLASLIHRSSVNYRDTIAEFRIYIPAGTSQIEIAWAGDGMINAKSTFGAVTATQLKITINVKNISGWKALILQLDGNVTLENAKLLKE